METFHFTKKIVWLIFAAEHLQATAAVREITQLSSTNHKEKITLKVSLVELFAVKLNKPVKTGLLFEFCDRRVKTSF